MSAHPGFSDLFGGMDRAADQLRELQKITQATSLQALLLAHSFYMAQDNTVAAEKIAPKIQRLTTLVMKG